MEAVNFYIETERLIFREFLSSDVDEFFEMDSDPEVHRYLGNNPVKNKEQAGVVIQSIRQQYIDNGIGRWAMTEKSSGNFIGWGGLKFITEPENNQTHFYDVGFRLNRKYWGNGFATESAMAALKYGFETMHLKEIIGTCHEDNIASRKALEKCGLKFVEKFMWGNLTCDWLKITTQEYEIQKRKHK